jgi:hypothetical protein
MGKDMVVVTASSDALFIFNSYLPKFAETKMGYVVHVQMRPNPLAN